MESVNTALVNTSIQRFLTGGLKIAALLEIANRLEPSYGVPVAALRSYSSIRGSAIASPVMKMSWTFSLSMISQVRCASNLGSRMVRWPANRCMSSAGLGTTVHQRAEREGHHPGVVGLLGLVVLGQRLTGVEVDATAERPPEVLVAPHDALREAGRAAGVDDVDVVGAALVEVALGALLSDGVLEGHAAERGDVRGVVRVGHVGEGDQGRELVVLGCALGDQVGVGALEQQRDHVGVVEQVVQLGLDVAVVDVDRHCPHLQRGQERDHVLDAVLGVERDVVTRLDPLGGQVVRQLVALALELGVGRGAVTHLHREVVGGGVDGVFEEISDVQGHGPRLEHVLVFR